MPLILSLLGVVVGVVAVRLVVWYWTHRADSEQPIRIALVIALVAFGFATWSALVLGISGKACTPQFSWQAAVTWWELYSLLGAGYMIGFIGLTAAAAFVAIKYLRFLRSPLVSTLCATVVVIATFVIGAALTRQGVCVYP